MEIFIAPLQGNYSEAFHVGEERLLVSDARPFAELLRRL